MKKPSKLDYEVGDKVEHIKYGIGKVVNINEQVTDFEVTVLFDEFGEKSFYSLFAKLKKCNV